MAQVLQCLFILLLLLITLICDDFCSQQGMMGQECDDANHISGDELPDLSELCIETNLTEIDCGGLELDKFIVSHAWQPDKVQILRLHNNKLTEIPDLSAFTNLLELDLSQNRISKVTDRAFVGLSQLQILNIEMNDGLILSNTTVSSAGVSSLTSLRILRYHFYAYRGSAAIFMILLEIQSGNAD